MELSKRSIITRLLCLVEKGLLIEIAQSPTPKKRYMKIYKANLKWMY